MTKEGKTVTIACLTVIFFAVYQYLISGTLVFPFPLNEFIFLIVALSFIPLHFKTSPYTVILTVLVGVLNVLHAQFFHEMILGWKDMQTLSESAVIDFLKVVYYIGLITWMIFTTQENKSLKIKIGVVVPIIILMLGAVHETTNGSLLLEFSSLGILFIYSLTQIKRSKMHYLWILLFILEFTKVWSLDSFAIN